MVTNLLQTFWNPKRPKSSNSPLHLSRSDSLGCPLQAKILKFFFEKRDLGLYSVTLSNIPPFTLCPPPTPASPTQTRGFPQCSNASEIIRLFEYVTLSYDLEMSARMENTGQSQKERSPGTF